VTAGNAISVNAGAYFKVMFTGTSCVLNFDISNNSAPFPEIYYRINNYTPWTKVTLSVGTVNCIIPADTTSGTVPEGGQTTTPNVLEVSIKSITETLDRWGVGLAPGVAPPAGVNFKGLTIDAGAVVSAPTKYPNTGLFFGTSITEGVRALAETAASGNDTDRNDTLSSWADVAGRACNMEFGKVGFGGSGLTVSGSGGVPPMPQSFDFIYSGVPRTFASKPNVIFIEETANDDANNTQAALIEVFNGLIAKNPQARLIITPSFSINSVYWVQKTYIQAAIAACSHPAAVTYADGTSIWIPAESSDGTHPFGTQSFNVIAPWVAAQINKALSGANNLFFRSF
jgi:hypothetical protein